MSPTANVFRHNETLWWEHLRDLSPGLSFTNSEPTVRRGQVFAKAAQQVSGRCKATSRAKAPTSALAHALPSPGFLPLYISYFHWPGLSSQILLCH